MSSAGFAAAWTDCHKENGPIFQAEYQRDRHLTKQEKNDSLLGKQIFPQLERFSYTVTTTCPSSTRTG